MPASAGQNITINGTVNHNVFGNGDNNDNGSAPGNDGFQLTKPANDNSVTINNNGYVQGDVAGGIAFSTSGSVTVTGNSVTNSGGEVQGNTHGGFALSDSGSATATGNSVAISGGKMQNALYGGFAGSTSGSATVTGNSVTISGGEVQGNVTGGDALSDSDSATVTGNSVTISGGEVQGNVYGGTASSVSSIATASGNSITISGGEVQGNVIGGDALSGSGSATATGNTITLSGKPTFGANDLIGGNTAAGGDAFSGNTLNIRNYQGSAVDSVRNFQQYNFVFPANQSGPVLTVTNTASLGDGTTGSTVTVGISGGGSMRPGQSVTLIDGTINPDGFSQTRAEGMYGVTLRCQWALDATTGLVATLNKVEGVPQAKALSEGYIAGTGLVNQGADLIAGPGMFDAVKAARAAREGAPSGTGGIGLAAFGTLSGGRLRYNTGSHVDMSSVSLMAGLAYGLDLGPGRLTLGGFLEYGNGSYDTYNSFSNAASVNGDGDMYHMGGGILGRMDFAASGPGHIYTEASLRAGGVSNEYASSDLRDFSGREAGYDSSSVYYGLHLGAGYVRNVTDKASLDLYGKFFWTRQGGDSLTLSTGDPVKFEDVDSIRLRFGGRLAYAFNGYVSPYIGAAWEHEFDGEAEAATHGIAHGIAIDAASLRGDTGIGELGLTLKPSQTLPLSFDLGAQGYMGKREGVTGSLQVKYEF